MRGLLGSHHVRVKLLRNLRDEPTCILPVEVHECKDSQRDETDQAVQAESWGGAHAGDEESSDNSTEPSSETMMKPLQNRLGGLTKFWWSVVCEVAGASRPDSCMSDPLNKFEGQDPPWVLKDRDVEESENVAEEPDA